MQDAKEGFLWDILLIDGFMRFLPTFCFSRSLRLRHPPRNTWQVRSYEGRDIRTSQFCA